MPIRVGGTIAACAALFASIALAQAAFAADQCTPFGDPPAQLNRGFFASSFAAHNPICFGGKVLGPWKDSDGSDRYACIYEPEPPYTTCS